MEVSTDIVRENRIHLLVTCIKDYMSKSEFRCYMKPAKVNGHPVGYGGSKTFKIKQCKKREKRK